MGKYVCFFQYVDFTSKRPLLYNFLQSVLVQFPNFLQFSPRSGNTLHVTPIILKSPQPNHYPVSLSGAPDIPVNNERNSRLTSLASTAGTGPEDDQQEQALDVHKLIHVSHTDLITERTSQLILSQEVFRICPSSSGDL